MQRVSCSSQLEKSTLNCLSCPGHLLLLVAVASCCLLLAVLLCIVDAAGDEYAIVDVVDVHLGNTYDFKNRRQNS